MPVAPTYPGVYIEEIPSGVQTLTGVSTSITAFIGYTARGPVNQPVHIFSFADFERAFGGLAVDSPLSYSGEVLLPERRRRGLHRARRARRDAGGARFLDDRQPPRRCVASRGRQRGDVGEQPPHLRRLRHRRSGEPVQFRVIELVDQNGNLVPGRTETFAISA